MKINRYFILWLLLMCASLGVSVFSFIKITNVPNIPLTQAPVESSVTVDMTGSGFESFVVYTDECLPFQNLAEYCKDKTILLVASKGNSAVVFFDDSTALVIISQNGNLVGTFVYVQKTELDS